MSDDRNQEWSTVWDTAIDAAVAKAEEMAASWDGFGYPEKNAVRGTARAIRELRGKFSERDVEMHVINMAKEPDKDGLL